ncbi:MAG TPA: D-alanine--D-alanine ligase [Spirochaetes bacterium]|nr:D-alanine--D-alanine ligase [Spirochaetota bacterium]
MVRVGVLYGGKSGEHEVSRCSAASVISALDRSKYDVTAVGIDRDGVWHVQKSPEIADDRDFGRVVKINPTGPWHLNHFPRQNALWLFNPVSGETRTVDVVFPVLHGTYGEDGTLQGMLELAMVPCVGADMGGSLIGMDKDLGKRLLCHAGIPVVPWVTVHAGLWRERGAAIAREALDTLGLPLFVKPVCAGSSVGIRKVKQPGELEGAVDFALKFDTRAIIEKGIDCREIECAVLGNEYPEASVPGEIVPRHEFYSYEAKYIDPDGAELIIPARLDDGMTARIRQVAVEAYRALNCGGMARVDFLMERDGGAFYLNEINTLPGFTSISMYPKLWEATGLPYPALLDRLIDLALDRHRKRAAVVTELIK